MPEERRTEILDTAEALFVSRGYAKTTVNDIIQSIGVAKGTFYYYFKSKEEVMKAIVERVAESVVATSKTIASDPSLNAAEKLFRVITARPKDDKAELLEELHGVDNAEMHLMSIKLGIVLITPILAGIVEQGIREGIFKTQHPHEVMEILLTSSQFLFDEGIFHWEPKELALKAKVFVESMEMLLGAQKGTFSYLYERITS